MQSDPPPPPWVDFFCGVSGEAFPVDWSTVKIDPALPSQTMTMSNGMKVTLSVEAKAPAIITRHDQIDVGNIVFTAQNTLDQSDLIGVYGEITPEYPESYITMSIELYGPLNGLFISIRDVDSARQGTDAVHIRVYDENDAPDPTTFTGTGIVRVIESFAYEAIPSKGVDSPGFDAALYAKANGSAQKFI